MAAETQAGGAHPEGAPRSIQQILGQVVVVDTDSSFIYMGRLEQADEQYLCLSEVDVHEMDGDAVSKERYIHETRRIGVRSNRKLTWVRQARVVSIARLEDVMAF